ncbi:MAG: hypothetical protein H0V82_04795 [Candidatus Protochlamydia sp.]|nr:hypothetical protein [Candidatus Protochlamydia sp.]
MGKPGALTWEDAILESFDKEPVTLKLEGGLDIIRKHLKSELKIMVKVKDINKQLRGQYDFIKGVGVLTNDLHDYNGKIQIKCRIACGKLYLLKERVSGDLINILDHLDLLLPKFESVGLFTFQNGIQNSKVDFKNMGYKIKENLEECPLCIGFYNPTEGIFTGILKDLQRLKLECYLNPIPFLAIRQMLLAMAEKLSSIKSHTVYWTHIARRRAYCQ